MSREIESYQEKSELHKKRLVPNYTIFYPLLVVNGPLLEYHITPEGPTEIKEVKHIVVARHYESQTVKGRFAIDIIQESYLKEYLELIEAEVGKFVNLLRRRRKTIINTIKNDIEKKQETAESEK